MAASTAVTPEDVPPRSDTSARTAQIAALTGLRGFAALMVVVVHVSVRTEYAGIGIAGYGPVGLFVLSGFLLYRPWARWGLKTADRPSMRVFARRRLARIFPAYLLVLFAIALVYPVSRPDTAAGWARAITLTWIYESDEVRWAMQHTWSLAVEVSWYVALPVLAGITTTLARTRSPKTGFWMSVAVIGLALPITFAWRWWVHANDLGIYFTYSFWLPGYLLCFAGGALVAHMLEGRRAGVVSLARVQSLARDPWALPLVALAAALLGTSSLGGPAGYVALELRQEALRLVCTLTVALTLLVIVVLGTQHTPVSRLLSTSWFNAVGRWSYGIYLWHVPVITIIAAEGTPFPDGPVGLALRLLLVLGLSVPLGAATYAWVEVPAIRWSQGSRAAVPRTTGSSGLSDFSAVAPDQVQDEPRDQGLRDDHAPNPASRSVSDQPTAPNPTQPRRLSPGG